MPTASMLGVLLTTWTIRLALACYVAFLAGGLVARRPQWQRFARWIWTIGCGLFVVHVGCAFHFYHHWSHRLAWLSTAEQTQELIGVAFGDGIYFSYLFLMLWVLDVIWLWSFGRSTLPACGNATGVPLAAATKSLTPLWRVLVHIFLFFIAFNGAIVFAHGPTQWAGIVACCGLAALAGRRGYNVYVQRRQQPDCEMIHEAEKAF